MTVEPFAEHNGDNHREHRIRRDPAAHTEGNTVTAEPNAVVTDHHSRGTTAAAVVNAVLDETRPRTPERTS
ncbi:hypothetical protein [Actinokineospora diospyrosa]|uniref:Uncharacterized protein n=1 Tax=Actinokineospora diospyrosa TaxID=103728 RepID=A0ABT1I861_9PSEU|nr:hypothetical protein [Actinokineospora diospyrosa]MCP2268811.1 hypothetical protein [Actinokineospora diospyrosa]